MCIKFSLLDFGYCTPIIDPALSLMVLILNVLSYHLHHTRAVTKHNNSLSLARHCSLLQTVRLIAYTGAEHQVKQNIRESFTIKNSEPSDWLENI